MRRPLIILLFLNLSWVTALTGQVLKLKEDKEQKDALGISYLLQKSGKGKLINKGDKVRLHYRGTLVDDRPFDNSYDRGQPFEFIVGMGQVIEGWDKAFLNLHGGDKVKLTIPPDLGYGNTPMPKIPEGSFLVFDLEILEVFPDFAPKPFSLKGKEKKTTASGLEYYIIEEGIGNAPVRSKTVEVHYTGFLENGDIFDSSVLKGQPISFRLGVGMVIPGWDEGIGLLKPGGKALLSIPYQLAYGENGRPPKIPAKARLIFNVELISVK
jgi:peptidylprolyl isomerase